MPCSGLSSSWCNVIANAWPNAAVLSAGSASNSLCKARSADSWQLGRCASSSRATDCAASNASITPATSPSAQAGSTTPVDGSTRIAVGGEKVNLRSGARNSDASKSAWKRRASRLEAVLNMYESTLRVCPAEPEKRSPLPLPLPWSLPALRPIMLPLLVLWSVGEAMLSWMGRGVG